MAAQEPPAPPLCRRRDHNGSGHALAVRPEGFQEMMQVPGGRIGLRDDRIDRTWTVEIRPFALAG